MQDGYTGYVDKSEWWWVTLISLTFLVFIFSPFIVVVLQGPAQSGQQFMGALHNLNDSAADLARMQQGAEGKWLLSFRYTPEANQGALVHPIYALLGQISGFLGQSPFLIYHIVRIFVGFFMYLTIYHLGASIWVKVRTRRIFFVIASAGAGFGWILALATGLHDVVAPDLMIPQAFPLYAAAANVHYPLAIACLCLLAAIIIPVLRPGSSVAPNAENGGVVCFLAALALAFIYPDALLPIGMAFILSVLIHWGLQRKATSYEGYWGLWILVPVLPILTYDVLSLSHNPFVAEWLQQRDRDLPSIWAVLIALGLPLLIGLPSIFRALRRFEADGDRFMLLWLLSMFLLVYLPIPLGQYLFVGLMLPIGYFATRSIEDFWFNFIKRRFRSILYIVLVPIFVLSHVFWLYLPVFGMMRGWYQINAMMLPQASSQAVLWMDLTLPDDALILAPPNVSLWLPAWVGGRVVYGHPTETANAEEKLAAVESWYRGEGDCMSLINQYQVAYVVVGTSPDEIDNSCLENWQLIYNLDGVRIYATEFAPDMPENEAP
jgi:hypothetical protein